MNKTAKKAVIEVDKKKLEYLIATTCPHFVSHGIKGSECRLTGIVCECRFGRCSVVKKALKDLLL